MLSAWLNTQVKVQRRASSSRNSLNEPSYGAEGSYPVAYATLDVRIEFWDKTMEWTEVGERIVPNQLYMYVEPEYTINPEDRITIISSDATPIVGQLYLVTAV